MTLVFIEPSSHIHAFTHEYTLLRVCMCVRVLSISIYVCACEVCIQGLDNLVKAHRLAVALHLQVKAAVSTSLIQSCHVGATFCQNKHTLSLCSLRTMSCARFNKTPLWVWMHVDVLCMDLCVIRPHIWSPLQIWWRIREPELRSDLPPFLY